MDSQLDLEVVASGGRAPLVLPVRRLWNGGWSGRDRASVYRHAAELAHMGVPAPTTVPIFFPLSTNLASTTDHVQVLGPETSGEIEYALVVGSDGAVYVTVASDHSDRGFERHGIQLSKQLYPDVVATEAWAYADVAAHWDRLILRCWAEQGGARSLYQEAALSELLSAADWLAILEREGLRRPGLVFLSGTPPTLGGLVFGDAFDLELEDPVLGRTIRHRYTVEVLGPGHQ